jgi:uncharacterized membrane protein YedE/YeeE
MDWASIWPPLLGGTLIGLSAAGLLALTGKTAGISGIVDGVLRGEKGELGWKAAFLLGLIGGGVLISLLVPGSLPESAPRALPWVLAAGVLVGFGTRLGGGCTSGHGVCGIGRASGRGFVGTCAFIAVGALTVVIMRAVGA